MDEMKEMLKMLLEGQNRLHEQLSSMDRRLESLQERCERLEGKMDGLQYQLNDAAESINHLVWRSATQEREIRRIKVRKREA